MNNYVNLINNMIKIGIEDIPNFEENEYKRSKTIHYRSIILLSSGR